jgi:hypothetical protein
MGRGAAQDHRLVGSHLPYSRFVMLCSQLLFLLGRHTGPHHQRARVLSVNPPCVTQSSSLGTGCMHVLPWMTMALAAAQPTGRRDWAGPLTAGGGCKLCVEQLLCLRGLAACLRPARCLAMSLAAAHHMGGGTEQDRRLVRTLAELLCWRGNLRCLLPGCADHCAAAAAAAAAAALL